MRVTETLFSVTLKFLCQTVTQMFTAMPAGVFGSKLSYKHNFVKQLHAMLVSYSYEKANTTRRRKVIRIIS